MMSELKKDQDPNRQVGLECIRCGCKHFFVVYVRRTSGGMVRRRRQCRNCGHKITTYEGEKRSWLNSLPV